MCITDSIKIGVEELEGTFVNFTWQPSIYLDDSTSENPTFTPPLGNGSITYTAYYQKGCFVDGLFAYGSFSVTVNYADGLAIDPTISNSTPIVDNESFETLITVNEVVDELEVCITGGTLDGNCLNFYRESDFTDGQLLFEMNHLISSCCSDITFNFKAIDYCGKTATTSIAWNKTGDFGILNTLPNIITPNGDGVNDSFCFTPNKSCYYTLEVINSWGTTIFNTVGNIINNEAICAWDGTNNDGDIVTHGNYWVDLRLYNDCGNEYFKHQKVNVFYAATGIMSQDSTFTDSSSNKMNYNNVQTNKNGSNNLTSNDKISIVSKQNGINIITQYNDNKTVFVFNNLGKLIYKNQLNQTFFKPLSSGIYYVMIIKNEKMILNEKIVVN